MPKFIRTLTIRFDAEVSQKEVPLFRGAVLHICGGHVDAVVLQRHLRMQPPAKLLAGGCKKLCRRLRFYAGRKLLFFYITRACIGVFPQINEQMGHQGL